VRGHRLRYECAELRAVGNDEESPHERKRREHPHRLTKEKSHEKTAGSARRKRDRHEPLASDAIRSESAPDAPGAADRDCPEGDERDYVAVRAAGGD